MAKKEAWYMFIVTASFSVFRGHRDPDDANSRAAALRMPSEHTESFRIPQCLAQTRCLPNTQGAFYMKESDIVTGPLILQELWGD